MDDESVRLKPIDLEEFMRMLPFLDAAELMAISAAYRDSDSRARDEARSAASAVAKTSGLIDELGRIQGSIIQWAGSDISRSSAFTLEGLRTNPMLGDIRIEAVPPLLDAATALLLTGSLDDVNRDLLLEPTDTMLG